MAFANNIGRDMTAADARAVAGQASWGDIFPDDFDFDSDPWDYLGEHRLFLDTHGEPHFVPGGNPFSGPLAKALERGEKDGLLARKASGDLDGVIRDTRSRYGEPKEWDHVVVGLSREDAATLGPDGVKEWARVVIRSTQDSPAGDGKRQMLVTGLHTDTDNPHVQFLLHRIPVNEDSRTVGASYELSRNSEAAGQMKQINTALEAAGLPMISDFRMGAFSVSEPRAASTEELARGAERVKEAGGVVPPDLTTGPVIQRERVTPEMRHLDALLSDAVKRQKEVEALATSAATAVAAAQHAKQALADYETEQKAREMAEATLAARTAELEASTAQLAETEAARTKLLEELGEVTTRAETAETSLGSTRAELADKVEEAERLTGELNTTLETLTAETEAKATAEAEVARLTGVSEGLANELAEADAREERITAQLAEVTEERLQAVAERDDLAKRLKAAEDREAAAVSALEADRATFADRAATWAEANVAGPLRNQIAELRAELAQVREGFKATLDSIKAAYEEQVAALRQAFGAQPSAPATDWRSRDPASWSREDRQAAETAFRKAQAGGKLQNISVEEWGGAQHRRWQKAHPGEDDQAGQGLKPRQPE